ncbi:MAG: tetratricopeptide repeat protein [Woeseiaceae bacterium]|nr:tetratricopeptide repeat protein [Woeseiaceae bacterium]
MLRFLSGLIAVALLAAPALADEETIGDASAHVLQAEIALSRGDYLVAAKEYRKAAETGSDVQHARRATEVADTFGFNEEALRAAERWLDLDPDSEQARWYVARQQLRAGDLRNARKSFKALIEQGDDDPDVRLLALVQALTGEDPQATSELVRALAKPYPESAQANFAVAVTALSAGEDDVAVERAQIAMELEPDWLKPKFLYARALLISGQDEKAIDFTARIVGDDPDPDPQARIELAVLMMSVGRYDDALSQVNQVLLEQPSRSDALRLMAIINFHEQNLDAAWDDFEDLLASGRYRNDALYYLGRIADYRGDHEQAMLLFKEVENGTHAIPSQRRSAAILAHELGDADEAMSQLDEFAHDNPYYAIDVVLAKAQLLASLDRYDEALGYYDEMVEYRPDTEDILLGRAELLLRMDRLDDALGQYRIAAKRWPESATSLNALGYTLADRTDEYREAEKLIRKALKYDPDSPAIIDSLGWVLHKRGQNEKALVELQRAYDAFKNDEVAAHIVEVLHALGRHEEAREMLASAERRFSDSKFLDDVSDRLYPGDAVD